jgi:putative AlgH/UPF0301 family transcriptional regulator
VYQVTENEFPVQATVFKTNKSGTFTGVTAEAIPDAYLVWVKVSGWAQKQLQQQKMLGVSAWLTLMKSADKQEFLLDSRILVLHATSIACCNCGSITLSLGTF